MMSQLLNVSKYVVIVGSLFLIDYSLGNGFVDMFLTIICKLMCFLKKAIDEEAKHAALQVAIENPISLPVLFTEIFVLTLTIALLKKYKYTAYRGKDRLDELLQESKDALQQTNEFLEKWKLRRINWQVPSEQNYLDDEPQEIKPLKLEVPILHMAIINTRGASRNQLERGDAGDSITFSDTALLSVTSLVDNDIDLSQLSEEMLNEDQRTLCYKPRYLWDVIEEDANSVDY